MICLMEEIATQQSLDRESHFLISDLMNKTHEKYDRKNHCIGKCRKSCILECKILYLNW